MSIIAMLVMASTEDNPIQRQPRETMGVYMYTKSTRHTCNHFSIISAQDLVGSMADLAADSVSAGGNTDATAG